MAIQLFHPHLPNCRAGPGPLAQLQAAAGDLGLMQSHLLMQRKGLAAPSKPVQRRAPVSDRALRPHQTDESVTEQIASSQTPRPPA